MIDILSTFQKSDLSPMTLTLSHPPTEPPIADRAMGVVAAALNDYATLLVLQQSLRTPPPEVHRAYEALHGTPLDIEALALDLRTIAAQMQALYAAGHLGG